MLQPTDNTSSAAASRRSRRLLRRVVRNMAVVDWIAGLYFGVLACALLATRHTNWEGSLKDVCIDWTMLILMLVLVRGEVVKRRRRVVALPRRHHRAGRAFVLPAPVDPAGGHLARARRADLRVRPERLRLRAVGRVGPLRDAEHRRVVRVLLFRLLLHPRVQRAAVPRPRGRQRSSFAHFGTGLVAQFCCTHVLYFIVPGFGPYHELRFDHQLQGGTFWGLVLESVDSAGALKDIFRACTPARRRSSRSSRSRTAALAVQVHVAGPRASAARRSSARRCSCAGTTSSTSSPASRSRRSTCSFGAASRLGARRRERLGLPGVFGPAPVPSMLERIRRSSQKTA